MSVSIWPVAFVVDTLVPIVERSRALLPARLRLSRDSREEVDKSGRELLEKSYYESDTITLFTRYENHSIQAEPTGPAIRPEQPLIRFKELIFPSE